jgi:hypothetical protein
VRAAAAVAEAAAPVLVPPMGLAARWATRLPASPLPRSRREALRSQRCLWLASSSLRARELCVCGFRAQSGRHVFALGMSIRAAKSTFGPAANAADGGFQARSRKRVCGLEKAKFTPRRYGSTLTLDENASSLVNAENSLWSRRGPQTAAYFHLSRRHSTSCFVPCASLCVASVEPSVAVNPRPLVLIWTPVIVSLSRNGPPAGTGTSPLDGRTFTKSRGKEAIHELRGPNPHLSGLRRGVHL